MSDLVSVLDSTLNDMTALKAHATSARDSVRRTDAVVTTMVDDTQKLYTALNPTDAAARIGKQISDGQKQMDETAGYISQGLGTLDDAVKTLRQKTETRVKKETDELSQLSAEMDRLGKQLAELQTSAKAELDQLSQRAADVLKQATDVITDTRTFLEGEFIVPVKAHQDKIAEDGSLLKTQVTTLGDAMGEHLTGFEKDVTTIKEELKGKLAEVSQGAQSTSDATMGQLEEGSRAATAAPAEEMKQVDAYMLKSEQAIGDRVKDLTATDDQYADNMTHRTVELKAIQNIPVELFNTLLKYKIVKTIKDARG